MSERLWYGLAGAGTPIVPPGSMGRPLIAMVISPRGNGFGSELADECDDLAHRGLEQQLALLRGGLARIALHTGLRKRRPPRHELERTIGPVEVCMLARRIVALVRRFRHVHCVRRDVQVQGG